MNKLDRIDHDARLYIIRCASGYSCLGFDVCEKRTAAYAEYLGEPELCGYEPGTIEAYESYNAACELIRKRFEETGERCEADLTPQLIGLEGKRVEVTTPDGEKSRFWVGKSTGWIPIHLEVKRRDSSGGCAAYVPEGATVRVVNSGPR